MMKINFYYQTHYDKIKCWPKVVNKSSSSKQYIGILDRLSITCVKIVSINKTFKNYKIIKFKHVSVVTVLAWNKKSMRNK